MIKSVVVAVLLSLCAETAWPQTSSAQGIPAAPTAKPAAKKAGQKTTAAAKPTSDNGACDIGVVAAAGKPIGLKKIGITVFGNEYSELISDAWGIDEVIVARVRAAAGPGAVVRRIAVGEDGLFELYKKPGKGLFNNPRENLTEAVRHIAGNIHCSRYVAITRSIGNLGGTNQSFEGIGVLAQGPFAKVAVVANAEIAVFDGPNFVMRDDPFASLGARLSQMGKDERVRAVEGAEFPASPEAAARDTRLRDAARALLAERLDRMLPEYLKN